MLNSFTADPKNETALHPHLTEGPDGSIWVASTAINEDGDELENTRIMKLSADLDSLEMDMELDLMIEKEQVFGLATMGSQLF